MTPANSARQPIRGKSKGPGSVKKASPKYDRPVAAKVFAPQAYPKAFPKGHPTEGKPHPLFGQKHPQELLLSTSADIAIFGGGAGGGKSFGVLLETTRHSGDSTFGAVVFRRTYPQIMQQGGLWDTSEEIFPYLGASSNKSETSWTFPSGAKVKFAHLQHEKNKLDWQGAQIPLLVFDELTHFTESMFFYLLSRNRTPTGCNVRPYVRATCNPDADSWVAKFIAWWIGDDGYPIPERAGKVRWFIRKDDKLVWADSKEELIREHHCKPNAPKSVTFIPSKLQDNLELMTRDPNYEGNLLALPRVEQERLLGGNWKIRPAAGLYFKRAKLKLIQSIPDDVVLWTRYWDRAATAEPEGMGRDDKSSDPDYTVGTLMGIREGGTVVVADVIRLRGDPFTVEATIKEAAIADRERFGYRYVVGFEQDPGQAGKFEAAHYLRLLTGFDVAIFPARQDKITRAGPFSAQVMGGLVEVVEGDWNEPWFIELEGFPEAGHDDQVDSAGGAFNLLAHRHNIPDPRMESEETNLRTQLQDVMNPNAGSEDDGFNPFLQSGG